MRACNRSQPHVDLLKHAVAILAHTARYQPLHSSLLASSDCVHTLAEQLQMFRDKEVCQACSEEFLSSDVLLVVSQQQGLFAVTFELLMTSCTRLPLCDADNLNWEPSSW